MSKHRRKWPRERKLLVALASAALVLITATGTTLAWLTANSATVTNSFDPAKITCETKETFKDGVKSDVRIQNTGTMDAYIRAVLIPVWKDGSSIAAKAASMSDCGMVWGDMTKWTLGADGYYYCTVPIPAGDYTPPLIDTCTAAASDGLRFELQISAQAVQALPATTLASVWSSSGLRVGAGGILEVAG